LGIVLKYNHCPDADGNNTIIIIIIIITLFSIAPVTQAQFVHLFFHINTQSFIVDYCFVFTMTIWCLFFMFLWFVSAHNVQCCQWGCHLDLIIEGLCEFWPVCKLISISCDIFIYVVLLQLNCKVQRWIRRCEIKLCFLFPISVYHCNLTCTL